jgi:hypothetical protein
MDIAINNRIFLNTCIVIFDISKSNIKKLRLENEHTKYPQNYKMISIY